MACIKKGDFFEMVCENFYSKNLNDNNLYTKVS